MATYNLEEQDKIDSFKSWWDNHGTSIVIIVSTLIAVVAGTQAWQYYQRQQAEQAADLYVLLQQIQSTEDPAKISDAAYLLMGGFPSSGYAARAAMIAAHASVEAGDNKHAKEQLQWMVDNAEEQALKDLARLRLAGVLLDEKKYQEALRLLEAKHGKSFAGLYADRKGDVLTAADKIVEARRAYQTAIDKLNKNNTYYNIVQMKLDALSEAKQ